MLPLIAMSVVVGCGCSKDRTIKDVQTAYNEMIVSFNLTEGNMFFTDTDNEFAIKINYSSDLQQAIENSSLSNDTQKRYKALFYQQQILDNIFAYYNNHQTAFYTYASGKEIDQDKINALYDSVKTLHEQLATFEKHYDAFIDSTSQGLSDIMKFNITTYSYHLNNLIDASFNFIFNFQSLYEKYGCENNYDMVSGTNLRSYVDKAYVDMSYIVYLECIKSFNQSVDVNGVCDLAPIIGSSSDYNLINLLDERKEISTSILENYGNDTAEGIIATDAVQSFMYVRDIYEQRLGTYINSYNNIDNETINQYQFGLVGGIDYDDYLKTLNSSERATIVLIDNFVGEIFTNYMTKLKSLI